MVTKQFNRHSASFQTFTKVLLLFFIIIPIFASVCSAASVAIKCSSESMDSKFSFNCNEAMVIQCDLDESANQIRKCHPSKIAIQIFPPILFAINPFPSSPRSLPFTLTQQPCLSPVETSLVAQKITLII